MRAGLPASILYASCIAIWKKASGEIFAFFLMSGWGVGSGWSLGSRG